MDGLEIVLIAIIGLAILLSIVLIIKPKMAATRDGKILGFVALFMLPLMAGSFGVQVHVEKATRTEFCLSCHLMEPYGKSLHVDDPGHIPAIHYINHRVPYDHACFTCHGDYTLFGDVKAKMRGMRHIWIQYTGNPQPPLKLYVPFPNGNCLHCHLGSRRFEEGATHNADPEIIKSIKEDKLSCVSSGCHETTHDIKNLDKAKFWPAGWTGDKK